MRSFAAHTLVLLATCASVSSSPFTLSLKKFQRAGPNPRGEGIHARAAVSTLHVTGGPSTIPATNRAFFYSAIVGVGNPMTNYTLMISTASANTWVGGMKPYNQTSTSFPTGEHVNVTYGSGYANGVEYLDQVALASNLVITNQSIGDATMPGGLEPGIDGIVGFGPPGLTTHTLTPDTNETISTLMDNLKSQGSIDHNVLGISLAPSESDPDINGYLNIGGIDGTLYVGDITYTPVTTTPPASMYWGINVDQIMYGEHAITSGPVAGILDTLTTQLAFAPRYFEAYADSIPGANYNATTDLLEIPESAIPSMYPLRFQIGDRTFVLDVAAQLVPTSQSVALGGGPGTYYSIVSNLGAFSTELQIVFGINFMMRFYVVLDADNNRVGFAETQHTYSS